jgi:hypothetical protein
VATAPKIRQLTDVSHCKLHQYLCCNGRIKCQAVDRISRDWPLRASRASRDRRPKPGKETQMNARVLTRPAARRKMRITLIAGPAAAAAARNEVRAAIRAWNVPVDPSVAVLLTGELVANALRHEAGRTIELVASCAYGQLQIDVYDTSPATALQVDTPAGAATGPGLMLLASLSSSWGYHRTPTGQAGYFTLLF